MIFIYDYGIIITFIGFLFQIIVSIQKQYNKISSGFKITKINYVFNLIFTLLLLILAIIDIGYFSLLLILIFILHTYLEHILTKYYNISIVNSKINKKYHLLNTTILSMLLIVSFVIYLIFYV